MTNKTWAIITVAALLAGAGVGRFSLPAKVVTKTVTVDNTKIDDHSTITTTKEPNGTIVTVEKKDIDTQETLHTDSSKTVERATEKWTVSAIATTNLSSPSSLIYGGQVQYRILGPFQVGALALTNGTIGVSVGISF